MLVVNLQIIILIVVVSLFFIPNSAFANGWITPAETIMFSLLVITIVVFPIALVYLGIISLKHFKPNLWNYIHNNNSIKIGFYFLAEGLSWVIFRAILSMSSSTWVPFGRVWTDYLILIVIPGIILISIGVAKDWLSNIPRLIGIIFLAVGIGWISFWTFILFCNTFSCFYSDNFIFFNRRNPHYKISKIEKQTTRPSKK